MANIFLQPCDEGVIRARQTVVPCARVSEPWILAATILGSSMTGLPLVMLTALCLALASAFVASLVIENR
jgi:hypothetical protein